MEKAQIVRDALMQIAALVYGVLGAGLAVKINKPLEEEGWALPAVCYYAKSFRDYGWGFFVVIIAWTIFVSYYSSPFAPREIRSRYLIISGIAFALFLAIIGTIITYIAIVAPRESL